MLLYYIKTRYQSLIAKIKYSSKNVRFKRGSLIDKTTFFEGHNSFSYNSKIYNSYVGFGTYIGESNKFSSVKIGRFCSIGSNIKNISGRHPVDTFVSTHPSFFSIHKQAGFTFVKSSKFEEKRYAKDSNYLVEIGNDVWIGDNVLILDGIKIGDGAIIGTGSIVTKDIEPYSVNAGCPTKKLKYRFKKDEIQLLNSFKWWNRSYEWIRENHFYFENIENFKFTFNEEN